jgi:hypothetical protein
MMHGQQNSKRDIGRFRPGLDNLNPPEGRLSFKDHSDDRIYSYVYQSRGGGGLNSLERRYLVKVTLKLHLGCCALS